MFDELAFNANNEFHFSIQLVQQGNETRTYYFQLIKNEWFLTRESHSQLRPCGEGDDATMADGSDISTNYLTGEIEEQEYSEKDCNPLKLVKKKSKFSLVRLSDFYPFMEIAPKQ